MEVLHVGRYARGMTLDSWDQDMRNCAIGNLLITDLARAETLDDVVVLRVGRPQGQAREQPQERGCEEGEEQG